jgi:hypothetical protein
MEISEKIAKRYIKKYIQDIYKDHRKAIMDIIKELGYNKYTLFMEKSDEETIEKKYFETMKKMYEIKKKLDKYKQLKNKDCSEIFLELKEKIINDNNLKNEIAKDKFNQIFTDEFLVKIISSLGYTIGFESIQYYKHEEIVLWFFTGCTIRYFNFNKCLKDDINIIYAFMKSKYYQMDFDCPYEFEDYSSGCHGPFIIDKMTHENYINISYEEMMEIINNMYIDDLCKSQDNNEQIDMMNSKIEEIVNNEEIIYYLNINLENEYYRRDSNVLSIFYDFIIINHKKNILINICFSQD